MSSGTYRRLTRSRICFFESALNCQFATFSHTSLIAAFDQGYAHGRLSQVDGGNQVEAIVAKGRSRAAALGAAYCRIEVTTRVVLGQEKGMFSEGRRRCTR